MSVEGIAMNTEMVPYREGGWNTNPHKLPGQTDFAPLTMSAGVFHDKPGMWNLAKMMFASSGAQGTIGMYEDFRFNMAVRVLDHPVTDGIASGSQGTIDGAVVGFAFYNCWAASHRLQRPQRHGQRHPHPPDDRPSRGLRHLLRQRGRVPSIHSRTGGGGTVPGAF